MLVVCFCWCCRAPGINVENFHTNTRREKERALQKVARRGGVVLTSYGMLVRPENTRMLSTVNGAEFKWVSVRSSQIDLDSMITGLGGMSLYS